MAFKPLCDDHPFILGGDPEKCVRCRRSEMDHSDLAACEACTNVGPCMLYLNKIFLCEECYDKEMEHQSPEKQEERVRIYRETVINLSAEIDSQVKITPNIFNAETISIGEIADAINADASVENKKAMLFEAVHSRYVNFKQVLLGIEQDRQDTMVKIRASYQYLVELSNKLTNEEREKYRLQDLNYKPNQVVVKSSPGTPRSKSKFSKAALVEASNTSGIPMPILQTLCVRFNCTPEEAVNRFKNANA